MPKTLLRNVGLVGVGLLLAPVASAGLAAVGVGSNADSAHEFDQFLTVFERVRSQYVDKVDDKTLIDGAINGMLASLDPHSSYLDAKDFQQLKTQTEGSYPGLGLSVTMEDGAVKVIAPTEDSPADRAGIKAGDYIVNIDGKLLYGGSLDESVQQMRGPAGSKVRLTLVRSGRDKPFDVTVTREVIELKPVKWEVKGRVGYININSFSKNTGEGVRAALSGIDKALGGQPLGYVVDLRSNPGGLLDQAIEASDAFLGHGEIVSQRGREKGDIQRYYATAGDMSHGLPIVVLVDAGSASAAEIVAGALQDQHRAIVMGERSFGKGSVQTLLPLTSDTALRLTTARYYTPSGRSVQEGGIQPDVVVPQLSDADYKSRPALREADLRRHLINQAKVDDKLLEDDANADPRFTATAAELEKKGVKDFQLQYALDTIARLATLAPPLGAPAVRTAAR